MRVLLHPPAGSGLDAIVMTEQLLAIGRRQQLFERFPRSVVAKLSKRHARLFVDAGQLYLVDLGSLNGTFVNGQQLEAEPRALANGDALTFGDLTFELDIEEPPVARAVRQLRLILKPDVANTSLESAVVSEFPFLIGKHSELFQRLLVEDPDSLAFLSRNHAQIIRLGDQFYLEDLGSTNGTAVNGQSIEEHLTLINGGDRLSFGDAALSFRVFLVEVTAEPATILAGEAEEMATVMVNGEPLSSEVSEVLESGRTIMVDSATSFIDVYFNAVADAGADAGAAEEPAEPATPSAATPRPGSVPRAVTEALLGDTSSARRWLQGGAAGLALAVGAAGFLYWQGADTRRLKALSEGDDPQATLTLASQLLERRPDDEQLQRTALEALQQALLPPWYYSFKAQDFERATKQLDTAREAGAVNPADDDLLELLTWATDVRAYLVTRAESGANGFDPIADAERVADLLSFWAEEQRQRTRVLRDLEASSAALSGVGEVVTADVRRLRALEFDTQPLRDLAGDLADGLAADSARVVEARMEQVIAELRLPLARQGLQAELETYRELKRLMDSQRWLDARALVVGQPFQTRPFQDYARLLLRSQLPDTAFVRAYEDAADAWRSGATELSRARLEELLNTPWAAVAERRLAEQRELLSGFRALASKADAASYPRALFDYYARLDPVRDQALVQQLRPAFQRHSKAALREATSSFAEAERRWQRYQALGRIQTEHRLAAEVDREFITLAGLLKESRLAFERGAAIYRQLSLEPSDSWARLQESLERELQMQRSAVRNLQVLAPTVRERKLALLGEDSGRSERG